MPDPLLIGALILLAALAIVAGPMVAAWRNTPSRNDRESTDVQ